MSRPPKLPFAATHVVKASRVLSWGEKAVWLETHALDLGPEGAWISNESLGIRLGLQPRTVKNYRTAFSTIQPEVHRLLVTVPRPGARQMGWVAVLPAECVPHQARVAPDIVVTLALALDGILRVAGWTPGRVLQDSQGGASADHVQGPQQALDGVRTSIGGGGRGELHPQAPSSRVTDVTFHPAVTEDGELPTQPGRMEEEGVRGRRRGASRVTEDDVRRVVGRSRGSSGP